MWEAILGALVDTRFLAETRDGAFAAVSVLACGHRSSLVGMVAR